MATCIEDLITRLEVVVRALELLKEGHTEDQLHECKAWELLAKIEELFIQVFDD